MGGGGHEHEALKVLSSERELQAVRPGAASPLTDRRRPMLLRERGRLWRVRGFRDQDEEGQQNEEKKCGFTVCIDKEPCKSGSVSLLHLVNAALGPELAQAALRDESPDKSSLFFPTTSVLYAREAKDCYDQNLVLEFNTP